MSQGLTGSGMLLFHLQENDEYTSLSCPLRDLCMGFLRYPHHLFTLGPQHLAPHHTLGQDQGMGYLGQEDLTPHLKKILI